jgi:chemotaxis protein CheC
VELNVPDVGLVKVADLLAGKGADPQSMVTAVKLSFDGHISGLSVLFFSPENAEKLVAMLIDGKPCGREMDMLRMGTLQEVGNIVLNGVMGSIANMIQSDVGYLPPDNYEVKFCDLLLHNTHYEAEVLFAQAAFQLEDHVIDGNVAIVFDERSLASLLEIIDAMIGESGSV